MKLHVRRMALAHVLFVLVTMTFVQHGDSRPETKKGLEALDVEE